jgi:hypothetical protein
LATFGFWRSFGCECGTDRNIKSTAPGDVSVRWDSRVSKLGLFPPPLWLGRGRYESQHWVLYLNLTTPTPDPSPQGGGEHAESVALLRG